MKQGTFSKKRPNRFSDEFLAAIEKAQKPVNKVIDTDEPMFPETQLEKVMMIAVVGLGCLSVLFLTMHDAMNIFGGSHD